MARQTEPGAANYRHHTGGQNINEEATINESKTKTGEGQHKHLSTTTEGRESSHTTSGRTPTDDTE